MSYKILFIDDDIKNQKAIKMFLEAHQFNVLIVDTIESALLYLEREEFALVLMDYQMPSQMGDVCTKIILEKYPNQQVAIFSCDPSRDALKQSMRAGAIEFIEKSARPEEILKIVTQYCNRYDSLFRTIQKPKSKSENRKLLESVGMVGQSEAMAVIANLVIKFASASDVPVIIHGETGTGKELIARALHEQSDRSHGKFIAVNCAAIPRELIESELFGHKKGAFTGAISDRDGKFSLASGGTLFLDEIGDMPLELQAKLLRVLQDKEVEPVGSSISKKIDVRIISATHKNLDQLEKQNLFRRDLIYRLRTLELHLPPLRERLDDIEPLVEYFTEEFNRRHRQTCRFQRRCLETLRQYPWPGNVRELKAVVECHLVQSSDGAVRPEDIDLKLYEPSNELMTKLATLAEFEKIQSKDKINFVKSCIDQLGSKAEAARRLGIKPSLLQYYLGLEKKQEKNIKI